MLTTPPTAAEIRAEIARHELKSFLLAARVGVHPNNLSGFLHGRRPMPSGLAERLMSAIAEAVAEKVRSA